MLYLYKVNFRVIQAQTTSSYHKKKNLSCGYTIFTLKLTDVESYVKKIKLPHCFKAN